MTTERQLQVKLTPERVRELEALAAKKRAVSIVLGENRALYKDNKALRAHAGRLANALKHLMAITHNENANQYKAAREALAGWEKGSQ